MKDYYQTLGVAKSATEDEIKKAYRRLAKQYHPDVNKGDAKSEERFKGISEAYNVLSDPKQRKQYDMFSAYGGGGGARPGGFHWEAGPGQGFNPEDFARGGQNVDMGDLGDLFGELFNMGGVRRGAYHQGGGRRQTQQEAVNGQNTFADVEISFNEAMEGTERKLSVKRGDHVEHLTVKIPAGVDNGSKVRVSGKGQPGFGGGSSGDLYLHIRVGSHPRFWREGADLYVEVPITIYQAVLGDKIEVPTLAGAKHLTIPAGTEGGKKFRIGGEGAPLLEKKGKQGDLYVIINVVPPKKVPAALKKAIEQMAEEYPYEPE